MTQQAPQHAGQQLACPRCGTKTPRSEWVLVFRRLSGFNERLPPLRVLKHRACKQMVYFLMEPSGAPNVARALKG